MKARSHGLIQKWTDKYIPTLKLCDTNDGPQPFGLSDVQSVFLIFFTGLVISIVLFIAERPYNAYKASLRSKTV